MNHVNAVVTTPQETTQQAKVIDISTALQTTETVSVLTNREEEIMQMISLGCQNKEIATRLFISIETVKVHVRNIYNKLGAHNRIEALIRWKG